MKKSGISSIEERRMYIWKCFIGEMKRFKDTWFKIKGGVESMLNLQQKN